MGKWIKGNKVLSIGIGLMLYALISFTLVALSYGWIVDIRPVVIGTDIVSFVVGMAMSIAFTEK
jgi:CHASE2 domain-containing sensor protein